LASRKYESEQAMKSLTFYLQFRRPAKPPGGEDPPAIAASGAQTTIIGRSGVSATLTPLPGLTAKLDNSFTLNQDGTLFFESGTITFGESADRITFASVGTGYVLGQPDPSSPLLQGTVMWRITGGSGFFANATGAIVSNFLVVPATGELIDNHVYLVYLPE
jgi:hypothetical protein